jgi:NAD(P)H-dependent FMN reductase
VNSASHVVVLATSESPSSGSQTLARALIEILSRRDIPAKLVDARESPESASVHEALLAATHVVFAVPIYNFGVNAIAKRWVEEAGGALEDKVVGFLCKAGGHRSYMSVLGFANALMLDFRCWIVPRFVYATDADFADSQPDVALSERLELFATELLSK